MNDLMYQIDDSNILVLGFTFKENCPDIRNTKVSDLAVELESMGANIFIHDPVMDLSLARTSYKDLKFLESPELKSYDAVIVAVAHLDFITLGKTNISSYLKNNRSLIFDLKSAFDLDEFSFRL